MSNYAKYIVTCLLFLLGMYLVFGLYFPGALVWYTTVICMLFSISVVGHFSMSWNFHLKAFTRHHQATQKNIAITFDDGPNAIYTPKVLAILEKFNATATFFCIGRNAIQHSELLKKIEAQGHTIANHSFTHSNTIDFSSTKTWVQEIEKTDLIIQNLTGVKPQFFRPPYGVTTPQLAKAIKQTKHQVIGWSIRPFDTLLKNKKRRLKSITRRVKPGAVILLHDSHERIPYILEHLLLFLQEHGYKTVAINDLIHDQS